jgi:hypothetical protein
MNFEALESGFEAGHDSFRRALRRGMVKPTIRVAGEPPQIRLGWLAPPYVVDGGGLRWRHWRRVEASSSSNVCERNNPVFCSHIFSLAILFQ